MNIMDNNSGNNDCVINLENVRVRFNKASVRVDNLKEYFVRLIRRELMFQEFIALDNINLKIKKGEAWGFVGTNGAGKSTLLKVISKILKPASGEVQVKGSVAALIELGAGIDPNLSARENIYLNGLLLGYSKEFIDSKFDEIVEFSELQEFLDAPVKNFSSGMKARLGFSVATAVEPDILIADEILSVGDIKFRQKCNKKMESMLENGTTLLYVSHNTASILKLCDKVLWLDHGKEVMKGDAEEVCDAYLDKMLVDKDDAKVKSTRARMERVKKEKKKKAEEKAAAEKSGSDGNTNENNQEDS